MTKKMSDDDETNEDNPVAEPEPVAKVRSKEGTSQHKDDAQQENVIEPATAVSHTKPEQVAKKQSTVTRVCSLNVTDFSAMNDSQKKSICRLLMHYDEIYLVVPKHEVVTKHGVVPDLGYSNTLKRQTANVRGFINLPNLKEKVLEIRWQLLMSHQKNLSRVQGQYLDPTKDDYKETIALRYAKQQERQKEKICQEIVRLKGVEPIDIQHHIYISTDTLNLAKDRTRIMRLGDAKADVVKGLNIELARIISTKENATLGIGSLKIRIELLKDAIQRIEKSDESYNFLSIYNTLETLLENTSPRNPLRYTGERLFKIMAPMEGRSNLIALKTAFFDKYQHELRDDQLQSKQHIRHGIRK